MVNTMISKCLNGYVELVDDYTIKKVINIETTEPEFLFNINKTHPEIIPKVFGVFINNSLTSIVMERLPFSLFDLNPNEDVLLSIFINIVYCIYLLSTIDIIHGDLKYDNIMLIENKTLKTLEINDVSITFFSYYDVKLIDFGLSSYNDDTNTSDLTFFSLHTLLTYNMDNTSIIYKILNYIINSNDSTCVIKSYYNHVKKLKVTNRRRHITMIYDMANYPNPIANPYNIFKTIKSYL